MKDYHSTGIWIYPVMVTLGFVSAVWLVKAGKGLQKLGWLSIFLTFLCESTNFHFLKCWCYSPFSSLPRKPSNLPVPHLVGLEWESLHCGQAIFVALRHLFELLLVFLPLSMAHLMSPSQAVLCNRDTSCLLHTECRQKVLVCFHCICSGPLSLEISADSTGS